MTDEEKIRERVRNFIKDFAEWNQRTFALWEADSEYISREFSQQECPRLGNECLDHHFLTPELANHALSSISLGSVAQHDPAFEHIESVEIDLGRAAVRTWISPPGNGSGFDYDLDRVAGEWLIVGLDIYFTEPGEKPKMAELKIDPSLQPLRVSNLPEGLEQLFTGENHILTRYNELHTRVVEAGPLSMKSGLIACGDPYEWSYEIPFMDVKVRPGSYPIQTVMSDSSLLAVRIIFDETSAVDGYAIATQIMPPDSGHDDWTREMTHIEAVRGSLALADAGYLATCDSNQLEKVGRYDFDGSDQDYSAGLKISTMPDGSSLIFFAGGNGGSIPFWALSESDKPVMLYIDFVEDAHPIDGDWKLGHFYRFAGPSPTDDLHWAALSARLHVDLPGILAAKRLRSEHHRLDRHYHTVQHLEECLSALEEARALADVPNADTIELALWFHDSVYDPRANDNEERSAQVAEEMLRRAGASLGLIADVSRLVLATKTHDHGGHEDAMWLNDIDLSIFGQSAERFAEYERQIRLEYEWVEEVVYREKRAEILRGFLDRPRIYLTDYFHERFDGRARANLRGLIEQLTQQG